MNYYKEIKEYSVMDYNVDLFYWYEGVFWLLGWYDVCLYNIMFLLVGWYLDEFGIIIDSFDIVGKL